MEVRPLIIGTAGHVDHGKTLLVRRLTGHDTDRLPEEKRRGISIELGFAPFVLPSGRRAAIVDVPGHERFIRQMLAGATGMDLVLLVVAADEGVMPQTREHLDILTLLGVRDGAIVLTKIDLVEPEWLPLVQEEIREAVAGTVLERAPIFPVSSLTGEGIPELLRHLDERVASLAPRDDGGPVRLPIDRAFTVSGFGTVVTGTLFSGRLHLDDRLLLVPGERVVRVRSIQVHSEPRQAARAGERVAVNAHGVERHEVRVGAQLLTPGSIQPSDVVYASVSLLPHVSPLKNHERLMLHALTLQLSALVVTLEDEEIGGGAKGLVRIHLGEPVWLTRGDLFVLRRISPATTIGGGRVITGEGRFRRRRTEDLERLRQLADERPEERAKVEWAGRVAVPHDEEAARRAEALGLEPRAMGATLFFLAPVRQRLARFAEALRQERYRLGWPREKLRQRLFPELDSRTFGSLLELLLHEGLVRQEGTLVSPQGHHVVLTEADAERVREFLETLRRTPFQPPTQAEAAARLGPDLVNYLVDRGTLIRIGEFVFLEEAVRAAEDRLAAFFAREERLTIATFRELLGTSRRFAVPLLEYFDAQHRTRRIGDVRVWSGGSTGEA